MKKAPPGFRRGFFIFGIQLSIKTFENFNRRLSEGAVQFGERVGCEGRGRTGFSGEVGTVVG